MKTSTTRSSWVTWLLLAYRLPGGSGSGVMQAPGGGPSRGTQPVVSASAEASREVPAPP
jgi:hypothetical protein